MVEHSKIKDNPINLKKVEGSEIVATLSAISLFRGCLHSFIIYHQLKFVRRR